ncbi:MAG: Fe-S protein assembly co-chaperone HscB, partial [Myxococcota bacterium]
FTTLDIEPRFDLDLKAVEARHRELSRALHPDKYVGRPASERRLALSKAIEVNEAWRIVRDPVRRAEALLARLGVQSGEEAGNQADPELLMEMMEQREALAEVRMEKDAERLATLTSNMQEREQKVLDALASALASPSPDSARGALPHLAELRFVRRFLEEASAVEDELL